MIAALIGFPQSGKSTLFAAVSGKQAQPGRGGGVDEAVVPVPDHRFEWLVSYYAPRKITNATINCVDLPGIDTGPGSSGAARRKIFERARLADILVLVVNAFGEGALESDPSGSGPQVELEALRTELLLADLEMVSLRIERLEKEATKPTKFQNQKKEELLVQRKILEVLEDEKPASEADLTGSERETIRSLGLLTMKPLMAVFNTGEGDISGESACQDTSRSGIPSIAVCAAFENELSHLDSAARKEFMVELGLSESAGERFIASCYEAMGLISFLTVGEDEVRAWPIRKGTHAHDAAGKIHSDIKRGFIRAETMSYEELRELGSEKAMKAAGRVRLEGKDYVIRDGDIISYRFNV